MQHSGSSPRDSCPNDFFLLSNLNRPAFLESILESFLPSASPAELKSLRRAIRDRQLSLRHSRPKGRPRAEQDSTWIRSTLKIIWLHEIGRKSWRQIASAIGLKPSLNAIRTLQQRRDHYALLLWTALPPAKSPAHPREALSRLLASKSLQRFLHSRLALPFHTHPAESKRLVLSLFSRGLDVAASQLSRPLRAPSASPAKPVGRAAPRK